MNAAPRHVDRFDLVRRLSLDGAVITLADEEIVADNSPERRNGQDECVHILALFRPDLKHQLALHHRQAQQIRPAIMVDDAETVILDQVEYGDAALMLSVRATAAQRLLIDFDGDETVVSHDLRLHSFEWTPTGHAPEGPLLRPGVAQQVPAPRTLPCRRAGRSSASGSHKARDRS